MKEKENQLFTKMTIFFFLVVLCLGLLVINQKKNDLKSKKIKQKITEYIDDNYSKEKEELKIGNIESKNNAYIVRISNVNNTKLYFTLTYKDNKMSSTHKKDYLEGKTLISFAQNELNNKLKEKNKNSYYSKLDITIDMKLNECSDIVKKRLLDNKFDIPIYTINDYQNIEITADKINQEIKKITNYIKQMDFSPKSYNLTYTNSNDVLKKVSIKFNSDIMKESGLNIGKEVINNNKSVLEKYNIEVKYIN